MLKCPIIFTLCRLINAFIRSADLMIKIIKLPVWYKEQSKIKTPHGRVGCLTWILLYFNLNFF